MRLGRRKPGRSVERRFCRHLRDQRHRNYPDLPNRRQDGARPSRDQPGGKAAGHRFRGRHSPFRHADHALHRVDGAVRAGREHLFPSAGAGIADVRAGARGRADARAAADDRHGHAGPVGDGTGQAKGDREAPFRDPRSRRHERAVHRQDRHADGSHDQARARDRRARRRESARLCLCLYQQPVRKRHEKPARRGDPRRPSVRHDRLEEDRRSAVRFRAAARLGPGRARRQAPSDRQGRAGGSAAAVRAIRGRGRRGAAARRRDAAQLRGHPRRTRRAGIPRAGHRKPRGRCEPRDRRDRRRERPGFLRLRRLPRSAESQRRRNDPGDGGCGHHREGADRRQRTGDPPCLRRDRRPGHGRAHRRRADASLGRGADRTIVTGQPVLPRQSAAEASHPAGAEAARPCRRLPGRRHQRRAGAARRRCRDLGRWRRRCRARGGRSDPARTRSFGGARRRGRTGAARSRTCPNTS